MAKDQSKLVTETLEKGVLTLTLGGGVAHTLSSQMIGALHAALARARQDAEVKVLVLYGPGHIFCAGHDLKEIAACRAEVDDGRAYLGRLFDNCAAMMTALATFPRPTIARVEGIATAAGLQMVATCDLAFASDQARFCLPGVTNGGFCSTPLVAVARAIGRRHAMELALSGETVDAVWAHRVGLINRVSTPECLADTVSDFARRLAAQHAPAIRQGKAAFDAQIALPLEQAYEVAGAAMLDHFMDPERIAIERESWAKKL
ncbi:enoyl-CoA hydratase-related protein [Shimia sp. W99]